MKRALIAMSGGVDSSVAAFLTKKQGFDCSAVTLKLYENEDVGESWEKSCCSLRDLAFARSVAEQMQMPFQVLNYSEAFKKEVMDRFVAAYLRGETPNPCIDCNRFIKFDLLLSEAHTLGFDYVVTGHYARVAYDEQRGRFCLHKALDPGKDQSYVLYALTQDQLSRLLLPLGPLHKTEVRALAARESFVNAGKRDSQDICFVMDGDYAAFVRQYSGRLAKEGDFVNRSGQVLGKHKGIIHYTIGQRKGLGLYGPRPHFVLAIDPEKNQVTVGEEEELYSRSLIAEQVNLIAYEKIEQPLRVRAKIRYRQPEQPGWAEMLVDGRLKLSFDQPQRAICKGQSVVLYDGDEVVGGGIIAAVEN